jgi:hypothetical protein
MQSISSHDRPLLDHRPGDHPDTGPTVGSCLGIDPARLNRPGIKQHMRETFEDWVRHDGSPRDMTDYLSRMRREVASAFEQADPDFLVECLATALAVSVAFDLRDAGGGSIGADRWLKVAKRLTVWVRPYWATHGPQGD